MKTTETTQSIQFLYDNEQYSKARELAVEAFMFSDDDDEKQTLICLIANSRLNSLDPPEDETLDEYYAERFQQAFHYACCVEDVWEIKDSLWTAFNLWEANGYRKMLDFMSNNPKSDNMDEYIHLPRKYAGQRLRLQLHCGRHPLEEEFMAANSLSADEYDERYAHDGSQKITKDARALLEIDAAEKIFSKIKNWVSKEAKGTLGDVVDLVNYTVKALVNAGVLSTMSVNDCSADIQVKGHKLKAEISRYLLETYVFPEGQKMSLYQNKRQIFLDWIQKSYNVITELDSEFIPPELPSHNMIPLSEVKAHLESLEEENTETATPTASEPITSAPTSSAQKSGGCYVATAVYGSYDCPEVWTLRRFRDYTLAETWYGRAFVRVYYAISPTLVKWFGHTAWFKKMWKGKLDRMVANLNAEGVEDTPYEDKHW